MASEFEVVTLKRWPDLRAESIEDQIDIAKICAFLAYRPSVKYLLSNRLEIDRYRTNMLLGGLIRNSHVTITQHNRAEIVDEADTEVCEKRPNNKVSKQSIWKNFFKWIRDDYSM